MASPRPHKRRGRPPLDPTSTLPSQELTLSLAAKDYQRVAAIARQHRTSVQAVLRSVVRRLVRDAPPST